MLHSQANIALDAFSVQVTKQKKSQIKKSVVMIAPGYKLWPIERFHWQLHNAYACITTASSLHVLNLKQTLQPCCCTWCIATNRLASCSRTSIKHSTSEHDTGLQKRY